MWKSSPNKGLLYAAALLYALVGARPLAAAGPVTSITILGLSNNPSFTAGVATNTTTTTIFINTFASGNSTPDAGERIILEILDNGTVITDAISPSSFTTTGTGVINGGNASLPITFFRASSSIQLRATAAGATRTSNNFTVVPGTAARLVVLGPGMTHAAGTDPSRTDGTSGTFTAQEPNQVFTVTVILTDNQFNLVSRNDTVSFTSGDLITLPSPGDLASGTRDFNVTLTGARITRTIVVADDSDGTVSAGSLEVTTAGPPSKEVFPFPSPFNPTQSDITFRFRLSDSKSVTLIVTDLFGQTVWEKSVSASSGFTDVAWNGRNDKGAIVAAGVYYVLLEIDGSIESKKRFGVVK